MKFQRTVLAPSVLVIALVAALLPATFVSTQAVAQGNNDYAPSATAQPPSPGSLPPPGLESGSITGHKKGHHGKGHKNQNSQNANPQRRQQMMAKVDTNGDGMIDDSERAAAKANRAARHAAGGAKGSGKHGGKHGGKGNPADRAARRQRMMARFDSNGDGQLDANEKAAVKAYRQQRKQQRMQRQSSGQ